MLWAKQELLERETKSVWLIQKREGGGGVKRVLQGFGHSGGASGWLLSNH